MDLKQNCKLLRGTKAMRLSGVCVFGLQKAWNCIEGRVPETEISLETKSLVVLSDEGGQKELLMTVAKGFAKLDGCGGKRIQISFEEGSEQSSAFIIVIGRSSKPIIKVSELVSPENYVDGPQNCKIRRSKWVGGERKNMCL